MKPSRHAKETPPSDALHCPDVAPTRCESRQCHSTAQSLRAVAAANGDPKDRARISVVVSTDSFPHVLDQCARALASQTISQDHFEVVFVDSNHAHDWKPFFDDFATGEGATLNFRYYKIANGGRASANNFGVRHTNSDLIIFLVDDFVPSKSFVETHLRFHEQNREPHMVGIGGGFFPDDIRADEFCRWLEDSGELFGVSFTAGADSWPAHYFNVANSSVKREFLLQAGLFNERFPFPAWDDYEMSVRLAAEGMNSVYLPEARATHWHQVAFRDGRAQMRRAGASAAIFEQMHPGHQPWGQPVDLVQATR